MHTASSIATQSECVCAVSTCASAVSMHQHVCNGAARCCGLSSKTTELPPPPPSAPNKARNPTTPPRPRDHELVKQMRHAAQPHLPAHKIRSTCSTQHKKGEIINWRWHRGTYTYRGCYRRREKGSYQERVKGAIKKDQVVAIFERVGSYQERMGSYL